MLNLLGVSSVILESTLMAYHDLMLCTVVLSNDARMDLAKNPKHLNLSLKHPIHIVSELFWNDEYLLINRTDQLALLWLKKRLETK
jgi:hypothetical protein